MLTHLVETALRENKDLRIATTRVEEFFGRYFATRGNQFPFVAGGGSAGREGPIAQISAALGSTVASLFKMTDAQRRLFLLCGMAGGIGAIFRAPLGGAIFAAEVLYLADFEAGVLIPAIISSVVRATPVSGRDGHVRRAVDLELLKEKLGL